MCGIYRNNAKYFLFLVLLVYLCGSCKARTTGSSASEVSSTLNLTGPISFEYTDEDGNIKKVILGILQPRGRIYYLPNGMKTLYNIIRNRVLSRDVDVSFFQKLAEDFNVVKTEELEPSDFINPYNDTDGYSSAKIGKNTINFFFRSDVLSASGVIPPALWVKNIDYSFFIFPDNNFTPEALVEQYKRLTESEKSNHPLLLFREGHIAFYYLMALYKDTYNLELFKFLREQVKIDEYFSKAATSLKSSYDWATGTAAFVIIPTHALSYWSAMFKQTTNITKTIATLTTATKIRAALTDNAVLVSAIILNMFPVNYANYLFKRSLLTNDRYFTALNRSRALHTWGLDGIKYNDDNTMVLNQINTYKSKVPSFVEFLNDPVIGSYLKNPVNYYDLIPLSKAIASLDYNKLTRIKAANVQILQNISSSLTSNANDQQLFLKALRLGVKSSYFSELLAIALQKEPSLKINFIPVKPTCDTLGYYDGSGLITIYTDRTASETELIKTTIMVLAHELWHVAKTNYILSQTTSFANEREFYLTIAVDDVVAELSKTKATFEVFPVKGTLKGAWDTVWHKGVSFFGFNVVSDASIITLDPEYFRKEKIYGVMAAKWKSHWDSVFGKTSILDSDQTNIGEIQEDLCFD